MGGVTPVIDQLPDIRIVVSFVGTEVLPMTRGRLRTFNGHVLQRRFHQPLIVRVGPGHRQRQRHAGAIGKQASFGARFGPIRGVGPPDFQN